MPNERKLFGLLTRKERWHLSWRGWLVVLIAIVGLGVIYVFNVYPFLAVNSPVQTDVLVVEGWIHNYAIKVAVSEFRNGNYRMVYSTGGPTPGSGGHYINDFNTYGSVGAEALVADGLPKEMVQMVPSHEAGRDRTYTSAVVLKQWFDEHGVHPVAVNVMTEDAHARRSWILFQKALGPEIRVGVIPIQNTDYDPARWWRYSEGVRDMLGETIAYVYAKFFFHP
ncbi:MAG: YdcF family protein [Chthoniobacterales bacterium]